jgi:hypothetical protein
LEANITKPALSVVDEDLDRFTPFKYNLLIALDQNSAACSLVDLKNQNYVAIEQVNFMNNQNIEQTFPLFENYFKSSVFAVIKYKSVLVTLASEFFTIVPQALYDENAAEDILQLNCQITFDSSTFSHTLNNIESTVTRYSSNNAKRPAGAFW